MTEVDMMLQAMDQMLTGSTVSESRENRRQQDGQDFGSMVRQRQQDSRTASRTADSGKTQNSKTGTSEQSAADNGKEATVEQIVIAAALMLPPNLDLITFETTPEENNLSVQIGEAFIPDMHIEAVDTAPILKAEDGVGRLLDHMVREAAPELETRMESMAEDFSGLMQSGTEDDGGEETVVMEAAPEAVPMFGLMNATPVKVASVQEQPVELEQPDGAEQLAGRVEEFLTEADGSSTVQITLEPPSLGKVTVNITHTADGALHVQLSATTMRAAELLQRNSGSLQHLLAETRNQVRVELRDTVRQDMAPLFVDPNGDNTRQQQQRQQQQHQRQKRESHEARDFLQQLRLGLVDLSGVV